MGKARTALIFGISGQDGAYLTRFLLEKGYVVHGTSRDVETASFANLASLGVREQVHLHSAALNDFRSVIQTLDRVGPDEIYNLAGQSSVALSFQQPAETLESISLATLNILEALRMTDSEARFYNAGSSECFGDTGNRPATEETAFRPRSPYAVAKAAAFWQVANYREAYGLHACSGILFNHESPLRHPRFVTRKVVSAAARIADGSKERLVLGNLDIRRDWGWAPEYVEAMWLMLQKDLPDDYVIATGESRSLQEFVAAAFAAFGLDWRDHVDVDRGLFRPADIALSAGNAEKARAKLGWQASTAMEGVVRGMAEAERTRLVKG
jgi:GDPmannose 4,6-dehydratase